MFGPHKRIYKFFTEHVNETTPLRYTNLIEQTTNGLNVCGENLVLGTTGTEESVLHASLNFICIYFHLNDIEKYYF